MPDHSLRPTVLVVCGHSGSGKTSVVRHLVNEISWTARNFLPRAASRDAPAAAWLESSPNPGVAVFGRWTAHHSVPGASKDMKSGRLDGCDRIHWSAVQLCASRIKPLRAIGTKLIVVDGTKLLTAGFYHAALSSEYAFRVLEIGCSKHNADRRKATREAAALAAGGAHVRTRHTPNNQWAARQPTWVDQTTTLSRAVTLAEIRRLARWALGIALPAGRVSRSLASTSPGPARMSRQSASRRAADDKRKRSKASKTTPRDKKPQLAKRRRSYKAATANLSAEELVFKRHHAAERARRSRQARGL